MILKGFIKALKKVRK